MTEKRKQTRYSPAFKERAIELGKELGHKRAAEILGMKPSTLSMMTQLHDLNMKTMSTKTPEDRAALEAAQELRRLKRENEELKKANIVLRELASVFSKDPLPPSLRWSKSKSKRQA